MIRLEMKNSNVILTAKISTCSSGKFDKYEHLTGEEILLSNQRKIIEQAIFAYSSLGKTLGKQTERQVGALKALEPNKQDELKHIEGMFLQNLMTDLIRAKLKEIVNLKDIIKTDKLNYKSKRKKVYNFSEFSLPIAFLRDMHEGYLSLEDPDDKQSNFAAKLKNIDRDKKQLKNSFLK